jgi:hypothetical protein
MAGLRRERMTRAPQPWQQGPATARALFRPAPTALLRGPLQVVDMLDRGCV